MKRAAQERQRGDADAAADQDRPGGARGDLARLGEGVAERAGDPDLLARLQRAEPVGAGADALDQEVEPHAVAAGPVSATEIARGRNGRRRRAAPVALGGQHVELARQRRRALAVEQREDPVAARGAVLDDLAAAPPRPERNGAVIEASPRPRTAAPWISWSSAPRRRPACRRRSPAPPRWRRSSS